MTREEIDAILDNGNQSKARSYSPGEIDAILDAGKQKKAAVSSPVSVKKEAAVVEKKETATQKANQVKLYPSYEDTLKRLEKSLSATKKYSMETNRELVEESDNVVKNFSQKNDMFFGKQGLTADEKNYLVEKWTTPGYKLTKDEQKQAKKMANDEYIKLANALYAKRKESDDFFERLGAKDPVDTEWLANAGPLTKAVTEGMIKADVNMGYTARDPEFERLQQLKNLSSKTSAYNAYVSNLFDALHFFDASSALLNGQNKLLGIDKEFTDEEVANTLGLSVEAAETQHPVASNVGNLAGTLSGYMVGSELMQGIPAISNWTGKAGAAIGKGAESGLGALGLRMVDSGSKGFANVGAKLLTGGAQKAGQAVGKGAANVIGDTMLDVALDTTPNAIEDARSGLSGKDVGINALKNVGTNLALNTLGEGVAQGLPQLGKVIDNAKNKANASRLAELEQLGKDLNPLANDVENSGTMLFKDKEKVDEMLSGKGLQSPKREEINNLFSNNSILNLEQSASNIPASTQKTNYILAQIAESASKKPKNEVYDPVEKALREPDVGLTHTPEQLRQMQEYYNSSNEKIVDFVNKVRNNEYVEPLEIATMSDRAAKDIYDLTGIDVSKNKIVLDDDSVKHIDNRHGKQGKADKSMSDDTTLSRVGYILDNYDEVFIGSKNSKKVRLANGKQAPQVVFVKKVDGSYYVVEAVTDAKSKTNRITSAYVSKGNDITAIKKEAIQVPNDLKSLDFTSNNGAELTSFDNSITNSAQNVNTVTDEVLENTTKKAGNMAEDTGFRSPELTVDARSLNNANVPSVSGQGMVDNVADGGKVSKARSNTLENSGINTKDELISEYLDENKFRYEEVGEKETLQSAVERVNSDAQGWHDKLMQADDFTATDVDTMMIIYRYLVQEARATNDKKLWEQASTVFKKIQETGTKNGQAIQAFAKWSRNTPEGMVADTFREIKDQAKKTVGDKKAQKLVDDLTDNLQEEIYNLADEVVKNGKDSRAGQIAYAKIGKIINENTPKSLGGVVKSYLMDSMLLNFRTLISRNAGGNLGYNAMEFARQPITAGIDKLASLKTGVRTRTGWSGAKMKSAIEGVAKGIKDEADDIAKGIHTAKSGQNDLQDVIYANSHPFKGNNAVTKALNKVDDITKHGLSVGDRPFYEAAYKQRLAELSDLKARNLLGEDIAKLSDDEFKEYAELAAKLDGLTATYQDYGAMAKAFDSLKESVGNLSKASIGVDVLSQLTMPFTRTPGNIITRSLEYSPLGVVKNAVNTGNEIRKGAFNQQRFADETGRNLLGMGLFGGGVMAYDNGLLTGSYSDDPDMKNAQKNSGMQEYALNTGKGNFDISWLPVLGSDLTAAAAFKEAYDKNADDPLQAVWQGATAGADALLNTSTLQGMNRMFGGNQSYSTEQNLLENAGSAMASGIGQAIPSLMRQVAQSTDEYERNISNGNRPYAVNNLINSVPVLRETMLQPKVDNEGNLEKSNQGRGLGSRLFENMISPGKYTELSNSVPNNEAMRLFESTGSNAAFLPTAKRNDITTDDFDPTDEQFKDYQQMRGQLNSEMAGALIESDFYNGLSDEEKTKALSDIYTGMKAVAKENSVDSYSSDDKIAAAYKEGGTDAVIKHMQKKHDFASVGLNEGKTTNQIYEDGGLEALKEYANYKSTVEGLGMTMNNTTQYLYENGGVPYLKAYNEIKTDADTDGNGSLKKDELIPYLDSTDLSTSQKHFWFGMLSKAKNPY